MAKKTKSAIDVELEGLPRMTVEQALEQDVLKLDLGGGNHPAEGYLNVDIQWYPEVDLLLDVTRLLEQLPARSVDAIMCRDTLQCFPHADIRRILKDWRTVLKPRSRIVVQCYDIDSVVEAYQSGDIDFSQFKLLMYGKQRDSHTFFQNCFNEKHLVKLMEKVGFEIQEVVHPEMRIKVVAIRGK